MILAALDVEHIHIRAGRPTSNRCVERVQQTLLDKLLDVSFAHCSTLKYTGLRRTLKCELLVYNTEVLAIAIGTMTDHDVEGWMPPLS